MKYIITENKLEQIIISYLNKYYGDLEEYRTDKYSKSIFFVKNKKVYMEYVLMYHKLWVDTTIWSDLENIFSLERRDTKSIIKKWVEDTYNLKGVNPLPDTIFYQHRWKEIF